MNKVAVYTAIFGGYDNATPLSHRSGDCDYFLFTDKSINSDFWKVIIVNDLSAFDDTRKARFLKVNGHPVLDSYEITIWIDGNIDVVSDFGSIDSLMGGFDICTFKHPSRSCIYSEGFACSLYMKDSLYKIYNQLLFLMKSRYPTKNGLVETNVLIRRNRRDLKAVSDLWWSMIRNYSKRDQLSFNFVLWKLGCDYGVMGEDNARGKSKIFRLKGFHRKTTLYIKFGRFIKRNLISRLFL